jgi:hypothetical protein
MPDALPPLPQPDAHTAAFWNACRRDELVVWRCVGCEHLFLPPGPCCPRCWSPGVAPRAVSGNGRVYSFCVYRRSYHPAVPAPYVVALVQLAEGPRMISNVVGCAPEEVRVDMPVRVRFDAVGEFSLPKFEPLGTGGEGS